LDRDDRRVVVLLARARDPGDLRRLDPALRLIAL